MASSIVIDLVTLGGSVGSRAEITDAYPKPSTSAIRRGPNRPAESPPRLGQALRARTTAPLVAQYADHPGCRRPANQRANARRAAMRDGTPIAGGNGVQDAVPAHTVGGLLRCPGWEAEGRVCDKEVLST